MSALRSIVYVSTAVIPTTGAAMEKLLLEARGLNAESGVTGVLLCSDVNFMQYFEGAHPAMVQTWDRIQRSRSHAGIIELLDAKIETRCFTDFTMGFARATESELLTLSTAQWQRMSKRRSSADSVALELLGQFWKNAR